MRNSPVEQSPLLARLNLLIAVALFLTAASVFMTTYSVNTEELVDSWFIFNRSGSLVRYGDEQYDLMAYFEPDRGDRVFAADDLYPLVTYEEDMLSVWFSMPLYWLGYTLNGVGIAHVVWLFNIFVSALAVSVMFLYARLLGYAPRTAIYAALMLAFSTALWPYSKTFLQEPITLLVTLTFAMVLEMWRRSQYRAVWAWLALPFMVFALWHSKSSAFVAIIGLAVIALPEAPARMKRLRPLEMITLAGILIFAVAAAFIDIRPLFDLFTGPSRNFDSPYIMVAIRTYLLSPNASIWATSPVLLLAIPGAWMLLRRGHSRYVWAGVLVLLGYAFGYAIFRGVHWYGSVAWPPRFLIPVIPMLLLIALPAIDRAVDMASHRIWGGITALLAVFGVWVSFNGISYHWADYDKLLPPGILMLQGESAFRILDARWFRLPELWATRPFDIAWVRVDNWIVPVLFCGLALLAGVWLIRSIRQEKARGGWALLAALAVGWTAVTIVGLRDLYGKDPLYYPVWDADLRMAVEVIEAETSPPDMVFVTGREHVQYFLNHDRVQNARLIGLPFQPGEQYSPQVPPVVVSDHIEDLLNPTTPQILRASAEGRDTLWLLTEFGPFHPWAVRPVERFLVTEFYPLREIEIASSVRLLEFAAIPAPALDAGGQPPDHAVFVTFDETIALDGVTLPDSDSFAPGDPLPITLHWSADETPTYDAIVALFLVTADGRVVAQGQDSPPVGGFAPTSTWELDTPILDNRALGVPPDLPAGEYQLWVRLYHWTPDGQQIILAVDGGEIAGDDADIAVLPVSITIE